jgi:hypothetical protein
MNCKAVRTHLLQATDPGRPFAAAAEHLAQCPACRQWQDRLRQLADALPLLPVPPTNAKADLLRKLEKIPVAPRQPVAVVAKPSRLAAFFNSPAFPPAALAAGLLVFAFTWWALPTPRGGQVAQVPKRPAPDPLLASMMQRHLELARAKSPGARLAALADLADDLHKETQALALANANVDDLDVLAQLYVQVVSQGVTERAPLVPEAERRDLLGPIVNRLEQTSKSADETAGRLHENSAAAKLQIIASAAREGLKQLRALQPTEGRP